MMHVNSGKLHIIILFARFMMVETTQEIEANSSLS